MTGAMIPAHRVVRHGRHLDGSVLGVWLVRRLDPAAFAQTMLILCLGLLIWPVQFGGLFSVTIVAGNSMEPTLDLGDAVVTWRERVTVGDVILYHVPDGEFGVGNPVIHRVVGGDATGWITQGDNSSAPDDWRPASSDVLGVAKVHIPFGGRVIAILKSWWVIAGLGGLVVGLLLWPDKDLTRGRHRS